MNDEGRALFNSSFVTPHSSFAFILYILSIPVNYFLLRPGRARTSPAPTPQTALNERGEDLVREQRAGGRQAQHVAVYFDEAGLAEAGEVCGVVGAHVQVVARAVLREVDAAREQAQAEEERFGASIPRVQFVA